MLSFSAKILKSRISRVLKRQGYSLKSDGSFVLNSSGKDDKQRKAHILAKAERVSESEKFILDTIPLVEKYMISGKELDISKIDPVLIEVRSGSKEEKLFRWWNIVWWSLPYEQAYGRQMRFIVWDKFHRAPIGLIGLQSPILNWSARDKYLGIKPETRDFWVNQSLSAQRIGALPPYNYIRGGKLVAMLMTAPKIRRKFNSKYRNQKTILLGRKLPANLLFITTTGAYGISSIYNRLKFKGEVVSQFIGYTKGSGTFHIPNVLYEDLISFLKKRGFATNRGYGNGPSRKIRLIDQALQLLGFENGITHGIKRAVYLFPMVNNLKEVIQNNKRPKWQNRSISEITGYWRERWSLPHSLKDTSYQEFSPVEFIKQARVDVKKYKDLCKGV